MHDIRSARGRTTLVLSPGRALVAPLAVGLLVLAGCSKTPEASAPAGAAASPVQDFMLAANQREWVDWNSGSASQCCRWSVSAP